MKKKLYQHKNLHLVLSVDFMYRHHFYSEEVFSCWFLGIFTIPSRFSFLVSDLYKFQQLVCKSSRTNGFPLQFYTTTFLLSFAHFCPNFRPVQAPGRPAGGHAGSGGGQLHLGGTGQISQVRDSDGGTTGGGQGSGKDRGETTLLLTIGMIRFKEKLKLSC